MILDLINLYPDAADLELLKRSSSPIILFLGGTGQPCGTTYSTTLLLLLLPLSLITCSRQVQYSGCTSSISSTTPSGSSTTPLLQRWVGAKGQTRGKAPTKGGANISGEHTLPFSDYQQMRRGMNSLKDLEHVNPD